MHVHKILIRMCKQLVTREVLRDCLHCCLLEVSIIVASCLTFDCSTVQAPQYHKLAIFTVKGMGESNKLDYKKGNASMQVMGFSFP